MSARGTLLRLSVSTAAVAAFLYGGHPPDSFGATHLTESSLTLVSSENTTAAPWCYGRGGTFRSDLRLARCLTEQYWARQFRAQGLYYRPIKSFKAYTGNGGPKCGSRVLGPGNAFYCQPSHYIAYDENLVFPFYKKLGNAALYTIFQHEFAHSIQAQLDLPTTRIWKELQADCLAGGTLRGLVDAGQLWWEPGDAQAIRNLFEEIGDRDLPWTDPSAHGSPQLRSSYYSKGYHRGIFAC